MEKMKKRGKSFKKSIMLYISKAAPHKYLRKYMKDGKWVYIYYESGQRPKRMEDEAVNTEDVTYLDASILKIQSQRKKLREALEFYAELNSWLERDFIGYPIALDDEGEKAREALKKLNEKL